MLFVLFIIELLWKARLLNSLQIVRVFLLVQFVDGTSVVKHKFEECNGSLLLIAEPVLISGYE